MLGDRWAEFRRIYRCMDIYMYTRRVYVHAARRFENWRRMGGGIARKTGRRPDLMAAPPPMTAQWKITRRQPSGSLGEGGDVPPLLRRLYENRDIRSHAQVAYSLAGLHAPGLLKGIQPAAALLARAIKTGAKILVVGDYDTDGATATAVAVLGLRALGAGRVAYMAPNRFVHGYGLSTAIAARILDDKPALVITVDNGISSLAGVAMLRDAGVAVLITDHHLPGDELPAAEAIVNPNQPGCEFPSKCIAGVGVMFYLLLALRAHMRHADGCVAEPNLATLLDLVALGTVADLVPLDGNNRILVQHGMARIRRGQCRPGILALLQVAGRRRENLSATDLSFTVAPRVNAAGRLDDISLGIECLLASDAKTANAYAQKLDAINTERRALQQSMQEQAMHMIAGLDLAAVDCMRGFCLRDDAWHHGVVGLVASRIKEKFNQPAIAFAPADDGGLRGSARSVDGLHIRDVLATISSRHPGMVEKFGGHAMAAGLTLAAAHFDEFAAAFHDAVAAHFAAYPQRREILTDGELDSAECTLEMTEMMRALPWGKGFPPPLFDGEFCVAQQKIVGAEHLKMTLQRLDDGQDFDAIAFRHVEIGQQAAEFDRVSVAYELDANEFRGQRTVQLLVRHIQPLAADSATSATV